MTTPQSLLGSYLQLARAGELRRRPLIRDKFLVLAGACAIDLNIPQVAAFCRRRILANNPGHLLRRYESFSNAMADEDFLTYLNALLRTYPLEKVEFMLETLGIDQQAARQAFRTELEYSAALLGTTVDGLNANFDQTSRGNLNPPVRGMMKRSHGADIGLATIALQAGDDSILAAGPLQDQLDSLPLEGVVPPSNTNQPTSIQRSYPEHPPKFVPSVDESENELGTNVFDAGEDDESSVLDTQEMDINETVEADRPDIPEPSADSTPTNSSEHRVEEEDSDMKADASLHHLPSENEEPSNHSIFDDAPTPPPLTKPAHANSDSDLLDLGGEKTKDDKPSSLSLPGNHPSAARLDSIRSLDPSDFGPASSLSLVFNLPTSPSLQGPPHELPNWEDEEDIDRQDAEEGREAINPWHLVMFLSIIIVTFVVGFCGLLLMK